MQKLLFVAVMATAVVGITFRLHLNKVKSQLGGTELSGSLNDTLKNNSERNSLSQALTKVMGPQAGIQPAYAGGSQGKIPEGQAVQPELDKLVATIQNGDADSQYAFERAMQLTSSPDLEPQRLTMLNASAALVGDSAVVRNAAMNVATTTQVQTPEDREVVAMAYKIYLQNANDAQMALNDTNQVLNSQSDSEIKTRIVFDCINKFPQLRDQLQQ